MKEERTGVIAEIIFRNDDNGYTVAVMESQAEPDEGEEIGAGEYFTVVGNLPRVSKGSRFKLIGQFKDHPTYGEQFAFTEFEEVMPTGKEAIFDFLASGIIKGIGPSTAASIVEKFGDETLRIMEEEPGRLLEVSGIGEKTMAKILTSYSAHREFAEVSLAFQSYGISAQQAMKLYKVYGKQAVALIEENPYRLVDEVPGFGFIKADKIAKQMGIPMDSQFRIISGIKYTLNWYVGDGNTYVPRTELTEKAAELLDVSIENVRDGILLSAMEGNIKLDILDGEEVCYLFPYFVAEKMVARNLELISKASLKPLTTDVDNMIRQAESESGIELSPRQKRAVLNSVANGISVITGGPGTGKTTIIDAIIRIFDRSGFTTAIAAPTGRAAKRITETSGRFAQTVHRLLEYYYDQELDEMKFGRNEESPLEYDVVLVDEASMIDLLLMQGLTKAISPGTRLILIGDSDQLPSVGPGNVLRDIIDSDFVGVTALTEIFRQAEESMIVVNAHRINNGEYPISNVTGKDFFFMERKSETLIRELLVELVEKRLPLYYDVKDPLADVQVLTPTRKGELGTGSLNTLLQEILNPPSPEKSEKRFGDKLFREGDKVMQIKNNYSIGWRRRRDFSEGEGIFNGDVGFISRIDNDGGTLTVIYDEDRFVEYDNTILDELELAYALTVHKSQGSEFPIVVMPVFYVPPMLATRNLLYTAVTRGKQAVVLCGGQRFVKSMVDNNRIKERYSGLKSRLLTLLEQ